jgi:hypothetical protein
MMSFCNEDVPMKRRRARMDSIRLANVLKLTCLIVALSPCGCCVGLWVFNYAHVVHEPPKSIGVRKDAKGNVVETIIREISYRTIGPIPVPHGHSTTKKIYTRYFIEEPGKSRIELTFLTGEKLAWSSDECLPMENSPVWVYARDVTHEKSEVEVIGFDRTQIVCRRTFPFVPNWNNSKQDYWFENGNGTFVYRTRDGHEAYDVMTNTVTRWKPGKK